MEEIVNKVASSGLETINLEEYYVPGNRMVFDMKDCLFQGLILREKDFRVFVQEHNWERYRDAFLAVTCTADAVVPTWAYMLVAAKLQDIAKRVVFGSLEVLETVLFEEELDKIDYTIWADKRVVIKGCSNLPVPAAAYVKLVGKLKPLVISIFYGEPCSTVPVYKRAVKKNREDNS